MPYKKITAWHLINNEFAFFFLVQAKGLVQQWAQLRYGVFEEHGFPNDDLLPYFYRHPDGYDAVSSSNDTEIKGDLKRFDRFSIYYVLFHVGEN